MGHHFISIPASKGKGLGFFKVLFWQRLELRDPFEILAASLEGVETPGRVAHQVGVQPEPGEGTRWYFDKGWY